ncbi:ER membrane protein complex subunit 8 [Folsomia candida]|uniref:ER membrane protein complex subunit 8 n=1 Tax=Folsomia candida TaxID=158441 RepID=UPI000B8FC4DB|nr:ER membrane protein complex subunit 8 [Folsomia candida]
MSSSPPPPQTSSSTSSEVTFSLECFSKIILHVTKYPQNPVNGLLIRKKLKGSPEDQPQGPRKLVIQDAIPLLHLCKYTTPMMEIALAQTEQFCKGAGYEIVGYYQANESLKDNTPDFVACRIAEKLAELNQNVLIVMVNNEQLNSNLECAPFNLYQRIDGKLKAKESRIHLQPDEDGALSTVSALIQAKVYRSLIDFDNHMEDISLNYWVNPTVNQMIEQLSS